MCYETNSLHANICPQKSLNVNHLQTFNPTDRIDSTLILMSEVTPQNNYCNGLCVFVGS